MPYEDFFIYSAEALALGANATLNPRINIQTDADFEIYEQAATAISRDFRAKMFETSSGRTQSDFGVPGAGFFGDGRRPFRLPVSKRLKRGSVYQASITDESGAGNQVRVAFIGAKIFRVAPFPRPEYVAREFFTYVAPFVPVAKDPDGVGSIAANGSAIFNVRIDESADFEIRKLTIVHDIAIPAASDTVATIKIQDASFGYDFMDRPIPVESLGAARITDANPPAMYPFVLRVPKLLQHSTVLTLTVANADTVNPLQIRIALHGAKLFTSRPEGG